MLLSGLDRYLVDCTLFNVVYTHFEHFVDNCRKLLKYEFPDVCMVNSGNSYGEIDVRGSVYNSKHISRSKTQGNIILDDFCKLVDGFCINFDRFYVTK